MANYLDENGLRTLISKIKDNFVPYTGATKNIDLGVRSVTANNIIANGSTKLVGGIKSLHTIRFSDPSQIYTIDILYEKEDDNAGGYNFIGVYNDSSDMNWIVNGHYSVNTTNQNTYVRFVVFDGEESKCSVHFITIDKDNVAQENYMKYLTDEDDLKTIGEKLNGGDVVYNNGLTVSSTGDVIVSENLIVQGNATLSGVTISGDTDADYIQSNKRNVDLTVHSAYGHCVLRVSDHHAMVFGDDLGEPFRVSLKDDPSAAGRGGKIVGHITGGASYVPTSNSDLTPKKYVDGEIGKLQTATGSDWEFLDKIAEKTFQKAFTEVKPGSSGIPSGNATVNVTATTYQKRIDGTVVGYKTIVDVTCRCEKFNLNDVGFNVLLSEVGSRWFMPRMAVSKGNMNSTAFNIMMDRLNAQKDRVGISVDEVSVFRDATTNLGALNVSGVINGQVAYDYAEFRVFAVMLELDKDNEGKAIPCTGAHYRIVLYHPETIL
jgi:hypothetical protein